MLLKSLRLENIRSYANDKIVFEKGSSLLLGDIGAGKTTVLLAIEFALFGLLKGDVAGSTLLRHGKNQGTVELCFEMEGKDIIIGRRLKRKSDTITQDSGYIIMDNKKTEGTPIELKSKILELFGYPEELLNKSTSMIFRYTVYTPQEDMKAILFDSKDDRIDILRRIFNIDKYKRVRENALGYAKDLRAAKKILDSKIMDLDDKKKIAEDLKVRNEQMQKTRQIITDDKESIAKTIEIISDELKNIDTEMQQLIALRKDLAVLDANMKASKAEDARLNKELSMSDFRIKSYEDKLKEYGSDVLDEESLRKELADSEKRFSDVNIAKETLKQRLQSKNDDLSNLAVEEAASLSSRRLSLLKSLESLPDKQKYVIDNKSILDSTLLELNSLNIERKNSEKIIAQLKDLDVCPVCQQHVDLAHRVKMTDKEDASIISVNRKLHDLMIKHDELKKSIKQADDELEQLRADELELKALEVRLQNVNSNLELKAQLERQIMELQQKKEKVDKIDVNKLVDIISKNRKMLNSIEARKHLNESLQERKVQRTEILGLLSKASQDIASSIKNIDDITMKIKALSDIEKKFLEKKSELEQQHMELHRKDLSLSSLDKELEYILNEIVKTNDDIKLKLKIKDRINYISELNFWISEHFINLTSIIEKAIMQRIHKEFNEVFRKWFDILMEDDLDVRIDEDFSPIIIQNNYETYIENLSGGERTAVALAYRLALNKVINDFISTIRTKDLIILDEPTDGFSSDQLDKMREVFSELDIGQMIIVSHEAKMESYVQNIIRIMKNEHESKVMTL